MCHLLNFETFIHLILFIISLTILICFWLQYQYTRYTDSKKIILNLCKEFNMTFIPEIKSGYYEDSVKYIYDTLPNFKEVLKQNVFKTITPKSLITDPFKEMYFNRLNKEIVLEDILD